MDLENYEIAYFISAIAHSQIARHTENVVNLNQSSPLVAIYQFVDHGFVNLIFEKRFWRINVSQVLS